MRRRIVDEVILHDELKAACRKLVESWLIGCRVTQDKVVIDAVTIYWRMCRRRFRRIVHIANGKAQVVLRPRITANHTDVARCLNIGASYNGFNNTIEVDGQVIASDFQPNSGPGATCEIL